MPSYREKWRETERGLIELDAKFELFLEAAQLERSLYGRTTRV